MNLHNIKPYIPEMALKCAMLIESLFPRNYEFTIRDGILFERTRAGFRASRDPGNWTRDSASYWQQAVNNGSHQWVENQNVHWVDL